MKKESIIAFFDRMAKDWDDRQPRDEKKLNFILDCGKVVENAAILDVACGTGILVPYYLQRNVKKVTAVDISSEMIKIARSKYPDAKVEFINADIEAMPVPPEKYDACIIYNALPHFINYAFLISRLSLFLKPGGCLTVAHGLSRRKLNSHHAGKAPDISQELISENELSRLFEPYFKVTKMVSDDEKYVVSGQRYK